jgi:hypothetical protein
MIIFLVTVLVGRAMWSMWRLSPTRVISRSFSSMLFTSVENNSASSTLPTLETLSLESSTEQKSQQRSGENRRKNRLPSLTSLDVFPYRSSVLTMEDAQIVIRQLGFIPLNLIEIGARNSQSHEPLTLVLYPLNQNEAVKGRYANGTRQPFPTIVWMSCPDLKAKISRLEHHGLGNLMQEILDRNTIQRDQCFSSPELQTFHRHLLDILREDVSDNRRNYVDQMAQAHHEYACERWYNIPREDIEYLRSTGWESALNFNVGIAGMKNFTQVKCLHTHYAHFLTRPSHGNIIGRWVHELMVKEDIIPSDYSYLAHQTRMTSYAHIVPERFEGSQTSENQTQEAEPPIR